MKNNSSYISLFYFIFKAQFIGLSSLSLLYTVKQDSYLTILLCFIIGFIPIFLISKIADDSNDNIITIINNRNKRIINILIGIIIIPIIFINFWNINNLIYSQYLNKTPLFIINLSLIIPIIMLISKSNKVIARVSFILFTFSILFFILSILGLINKINLANLLPFLEHNPTKGITPYFSYNILSSFIILVFPGKYVKKNIIKGYILSSIIIIITMIVLISVLGINLTLLFQYPEFNLLKLAYTGIVSFRLENILAIQWLIDIFIFISICFKYCNESLNIKKTYILPIIFLIINSFIVIDSTYIRNIIVNTLPYIYFIIFTLIIITMYIIKKSNRKTITN